MQFKTLATVAAIAFAAFSQANPIEKREDVSLFERTAICDIVPE